LRRSRSADHHAALSVLFEITDVARARSQDRLLQELERRSSCSSRCATIRRSSLACLEQLLADIDRASAALLAQTAGPACTCATTNG
jgi:cell division FtsZ-interacting protein ZapD